MLARPFITPTTQLCKHLLQSMTLTPWKPAQRKSMAALTVKDVTLALQSSATWVTSNVNEVDG